MASPASHPGAVVAGVPPRTDPPAAAPAARPLCRSDFDFDLPPELIAQHPAEHREDARLLHVAPDGWNDGHIPDLLGYLHPGDVLVLNDTRVIKARLLGQKQSGGRVEVLVERILSPHRAQVLLRTSHAPRPGLPLRFRAISEDGPASPVSVGATVLGRSDDLFELEFDAPVEEVLKTLGQVPLPPYIHHAPNANDAARYQTVYARSPGAVAAPTAGLHLTENLLQQCRARGVHLAYVTLHVGAGTFQPVRTERLSEHRMHAERYEVPAKTARIVNEARERGRQILAVGTTSVRALESSMREGALQPGSGETRLFIVPGFRFQCVDRLLTNFHLPGSTLLMLVAAFGGTERVLRAYRHAVAAGYRFFSYGDAMLVERDAGAGVRLAACDRKDL
ncbi:MAG TPA: tRNA preQ1(34) S-adenosylmethionine ribosyltransferase-isomerase QueA [Burkholderiaceae bacterium]|nr:tRNA preQ1(34) S-adenosylmethionine ribosyltransferase-isomerase QueA [Burkholderiaceae bacterium]